MKIKITKGKKESYKVSTHMTYKNINDEKTLLVYMLRNFKDLCNAIEQKLYEIENNKER